MICCANAQDYSRNLSLLISKLLAPVYLGAYYYRCEGRGLQNSQEKHRMDQQEDGVKGVVGRSKIDCLAGVQVGNRLMLNKVFRNQTGGVFSLNISSDIYFPTFHKSLIGMLQSCSTTDTILKTVLVFWF